MTLLLVDDESNILRALTRMLRRDGYKILTASSGKEGLEVVNDNPDIKVIISDQRMPEMSGTEFLSQVKEISPSIIRIILSGFSDLNTITEAINKGEIFRFISKPWDDDILRENVKDAFRHYQLYTLNEEFLLDLQRHGLTPHQLSVLLDNLPQAIITIDDQQSIHFANQQANLIFNNSEPLKGMLLQEAIPALCEPLASQQPQPIVISQQHYQTTFSKMQIGQEEQLLVTLTPIS